MSAVVRGELEAGVDAPRGALGKGDADVGRVRRNEVLADVNYIHPRTTTTSPHRPPFGDRGSWSWFV